MIGAKADLGITVQVADAPVIALVNLTTVNVECGAIYTDASATAGDNCDGDLTSNIIVGGDVVDTGVPGLYTITCKLRGKHGRGKDSRTWVYCKHRAA